MLWFAISSCVKEAVWEPEAAPPDMLVVDALLTDEIREQTIFLGRPVSGPNEVPQPVTGATVLVSNEDSSWQFREDSLNPGNYLTPAWFSTKPGKTYTLLISLNDRIFSARSSQLPSSPFTELKYSRADNGLYYIDWVANAFSAGDASMWEILIDWSVVPGYENQPPEKTHARLLFYSLPTLDVSEIFAPRMEQTLFPVGALITERRYSLNSSHAAFIREMLLETNWTGGLFAVAPANLSTNLSSGATGYFGTCGVYELSLVVTAK
jgi:hypothetical protein